MKCSVCGKEFGNNENCQYCGVDKVRGLANYNGYYENGNQGANNPQNGVQYNPSMIACYSCGEIIPANSKFCPVCSTKLWEKCPKCGRECSSQFVICNHCGTNRKLYLKEQKEHEGRLLEEKKREQKIKYEAECLKEEKSVIWPYFLFAIIWILFNWLMLSHPRDSSFENTVLFIILSAVCYGFARWGCYMILSEKLQKWIRQHPNDPRCEYLRRYV